MGGFSSMEVFIPERFRRESMYELLEAVIDHDLKPKDNHIIFNFRKLKFIEPVGVAILGNLFQWLLKNKVNYACKLPSRTDNKDAIKYLDDSLFFKRYLGKTIRDDASLRKTTIPLTLVTYEDSYQFSRQRFSYWLANSLDVTVESVDGIRISLEEIFNNINDHAQENTGCFFAQHYPRMGDENTVHIAISDFGVGIPYNIQKRNPKLNDGEALQLAIEEGVSTGTPKNRGVGLATIVANIVKNHDGEMYIYSNHGILTCKTGNNEVDVEYKISPSYYPGTLIQIKLKADNIENIILDEEDFEW